MRRRFWFQTMAAVVTAALLVLTFVWRDWIEIIFHTDPDSHSGLVELLVWGVLFAVVATLSGLASYEWKRSRVFAAA